MEDICKEIKMTFQKEDKVKILNPFSKYYQQIGIIEEVIADNLYSIQMGNEGIAEVLYTLEGKDYLQKVENET